MIRLGNIRIAELRLGTGKISAAYLGAVKIWPDGGGASGPAGDEYLSARVLHLDAAGTAGVISAVPEDASDVRVTLPAAVAGKLSATVSGRDVSFTRTAEFGRVKVEISFDVPGEERAVCEALVFGKAAPGEITISPTDKTLAAETAGGVPAAEFSGSADEACGALDAVSLVYNSALYAADVRTLSAARNADSATRWSGQVSAAPDQEKETRFYAAVCGANGGAALMLVRADAAYAIVPKTPPPWEENDPADGVDLSAAIFAFLEPTGMRVDWREGRHPIRFRIVNAPSDFEKLEGETENQRKNRWLESVVIFRVEYLEGETYEDSDGETRFTEWLTIDKTAAAYDYVDQNSAESGCVAAERELIFMRCAANVNSRSGAYPRRKAKISAGLMQPDVDEETGVQKTDPDTGEPLTKFVEISSTSVEQTMLWAHVSARCCLFADSDICGLGRYPNTNAAYEMRFKLSPNGVSGGAMTTLFTPQVGSFASDAADEPEEPLELMLFGAPLDTGSIPYGGRFAVELENLSASWTDDDSWSGSNQRVLRCLRGTLSYVFIQWWRKIEIFRDEDGNVSSGSFDTAEALSTTISHAYDFVPLTGCDLNAMTVSLADGGTKTVICALVVSGGAGSVFRLVNCVADGVHYADAEWTPPADENFAVVYACGTDSAVAWVSSSGYLDLLPSFSSWNPPADALPLYAARAVVYADGSAGFVSRGEFRVPAPPSSTYAYGEAARSFLPNAELVRAGEELPESFSHVGSQPMRARFLQRAELYKKPAAVETYNFFGSVAEKPYEIEDFEGVLNLFGNRELSHASTSDLIAKFIFDSDLDIHDWTTFKFFLPAQKTD